MVASYYESVADHVEWVASHHESVADHVEWVASHHECVADHIEWVASPLNEEAELFLTAIATVGAKEVNQQSDVF